MKYLYIMSGESRSMTKIGISKNPARRLEQIRKSRAYSLSCPDAELLAVYEPNDNEDARNLEKMLHNCIREKFDAVRGTEWFDCDPYYPAVLIHAWGIAKPIELRALTPTSA